MKLERADPPFYLLLSLVTIVALHLFIPGARVVPTHWNVLGAFPLVVGVVLNLIADTSFKQHQTSVKPLGETSALVTSGTFRISRHPMYLGFVLILLGAATIAGSATPFLVVVGFFVFMDIVFVRFEELKLAQTFGDAWLDYKAEVRRWI
jgi:protein-S-isoprenylcysteine O-methyltransferase Ste14